MSTDTLRTKEPQCAENCAEAAVSTPMTLASIVNSIKHDAQRAAKAYLAETEVKHGGE